MKYTDLDFFQPERDRIALKRKKMLPYAIIAAVLIGVLLYVIHLHFREISLQNQLLDINNESLTVQTEITQLELKIDETKKKIDRLENGLNYLDPFGAASSASMNDIKKEHLDAIISSTPKEAFYSKILIEEDILTLEGYTYSTQVIAKIVYNLELTGYFDNVLIKNVTADENTGYSFTINADIKE